MCDNMHWTASEGGQWNASRGTTFVTGIHILYKHITNSFIIVIGYVSVCDMVLLYKDYVNSFWGGYYYIYPPKKKSITPPSYFFSSQN